MRHTVTMLLLIVAITCDIPEIKTMPFIRNDITDSQAYWCPVRKTSVLVEYAGKCAITGANLYTEDGAEPQFDRIKDDNARILLRASDVADAQRDLVVARKVEKDPELKRQAIEKMKERGKK